MVQTARPDSDTLNNSANWESTNEPGMPGEFVLYTEVDDTTIADEDEGTEPPDDTYCSLDASSSEDILYLRLSDGITEPNVDTGHKIKYRYWSDGSSSDLTVTVKLWEGTAVAGATERATETRDISGVSDGAYHSMNIGSATIGNYNNLFLSIHFVDGDMSDVVYLSQIYLEAPDVVSAAAATSEAFLLFLD